MCRNLRPRKLRPPNIFKECYGCSHTCIFLRCMITATVFHNLFLTHKDTMTQRSKMPSRTNQLVLSSRFQAIAWAELNICRQWRSEMKLVLRPLAKMHSLFLLLVQIQIKLELCLLSMGLSKCAKLQLIHSFFFCFFFN